ncbi:MAG: hypothetical protein J6X88_00015 [Bacteroidales bacterium]|nr:hypothetical protein [Bacteroidales bacterium]
MKHLYTKAAAAIMLMLATVLATGCVKEHMDPRTNDEVNINPEYVSINWETTTVTTYDDSTGDYTIQFADTVPDIHPGSVIAIDRDTVVLYRFVLTSTVNGNVMNLTTDDADLTDIFYDTEFTLTTASSSKSLLRGAVFRPVAAYALGDDGSHKTLPLDGAGKGDTRFTHNLWHYGFNYDGLVIDQSLFHQLLLDRMNMDLDFDLEMYMNFGGREVSEVVSDALVRYMSKALQLNTALVGRFSTEQQIRFRAFGGYSLSSPSITLKNDVIPALSKLTIRFMAGPVPIVLNLHADLCLKMAGSGSGEIQAYTGFADRAEGRIGFEWSQSAGISPVSTFENTFSFTPPTLEGKGQLQNKVWLFPRISVMLYNVIGPALDIMPYVADTVRGGYREQLLGTTNDYCAWTNDLHAGLDLGYEINLNLFKRQIWNDIAGWPLPSGSMNIVDKPLLHSPKKVVHASGRPQGGQTATVRFDVYDQNYLFNQEVMTPLPQIVKFEASGNLSSEYGIAHNGTVQVDWTPNNTDVLYVKLYDWNDNVISWDSVKFGSSDPDDPDDPDNPYDPADWVDLGLPSGLLWATRNVGASSPTDYGNYYAWGETSSKSVYNWYSYRYCVYNGNTGELRLTKYCNEDGLTTLQPGDDAATANYGGRTPTDDEWYELISNTTSRWMTINGVNGRFFTGSNGNSIFLPAAGARLDDSLYFDGFSVEYWSSCLDGDIGSGGAPTWSFSAGDVNYNGAHWSRDSGLSVRAVR